MPEAILAINAGSSSTKFAAFAIVGSALKLICKGKLDHHDGEAVFVVKDADGKVRPDSSAGATDSGSSFTTALMRRIEPLLGDHRLAAVGHRIVHGGPDFGAPVEIDETVLQRLEALTPMAPLHQPA